MRCQDDNNSTTITRANEWFTFVFDRKCIEDNLKTLTTKHLSYYSSFYFQFMLKFVKMNGNLVEQVMEHLNEQICVVEQLRGAGPDAKLRSANNNEFVRNPIE